MPSSFVDEGSPKRSNGLWYPSSRTVSARHSTSHPTVNASATPAALPAACKLRQHIMLRGNRYMVVAFALRLVLICYAEWQDSNSTTPVAA